MLLTLTQLTALLIVTPDYPEFTQLNISCTQTQTIKLTKEITQQRINSKFIPIKLTNKKLCNKQISIKYLPTTATTNKTFINKLNTYLQANH